MNEVALWLNWILLERRNKQMKERSAHETAQEPVLPLPEVLLLSYSFPVKAANSFTYFPLSPWLIELSKINTPSLFILELTR